MKNIFKAAKNYCTNPDYRFRFKAQLGLYDNMPDEDYLRKMFKAKLGYPLNLDNPRTFNEKLQWLKLHDRNPLYTTLVDKYAVKDYVAGIIGEECIIPTLGVWEYFDEIDFDALPEQFVLKCTHDSGGLVICRDKKTLNKRAAKAKLERCLKRNYYYLGREWPYKDVKPRILAEQYMEAFPVATELLDYKFFTFNGVAKAMFIATERQNPETETKFDFFDMNFQHLDFMNGHPNANKEIKRPATFDDMKLLAEKISQGIPHLRVDFYEINGKVYFGELTFFHHSGFVPFEPEIWDYTFGDWLNLPKSIGKPPLL